MRSVDNVPIVVTGGTGTLGTLVAARLRDAGRTVRVVSRGRRTHDAQGIEHAVADLATGDGVASAIAGADVIVHCAGSATGDDAKARHLVDAATRSKARHIVYISVVGADRVPVSSAIDRAMFGYFGAKLASERVIAGSGIAWTTLRATQFHQLMFATVRQMSKLPVVIVPGGMRFQPIDAAEVAVRLAEIALGDPAGLVPEIAGPRIYGMAELVRTYLDATNRQRPVIGLPLPGRAAAAFRSGANLAPDRAVGRVTWEEYLAANVGGRRLSGATLR